MACPSNYPIDTGETCTKLECSINTSCGSYGSSVYAYYFTHYYTRCKNSNNDTVCNYITSVKESSCCIVSGGW